MNEIKIKDIYAGKPDAKDEIDFGGLEEFIKTYVVAEHFNVESLISGTNCFITGFKGTGKTALLFYLDSRFKEIDESTCSSFIFFKEEFTDTKRSELESIARRILSSISVEKMLLWIIKNLNIFGVGFYSNELFLIMKNIIGISL